VAAAEATLRQANMEAPFSGVVTSVNTKVGDQVSPGLPAFRIDDLSSLLVDVDISEVDINRITIGQEASISLDAVTDKEYNGRVTEVSLVGTTVAGVVSFRVTIELINPDASVRPGMTAGINVVVNKLENVLLVPNRAVRLRNGERVVYVYDEAAGELTPVDVQLGASSELYSEVLSGDVNVGDAIVLNPPNESFFGGGPPGGPPGGN
jgi:HlyD family secretion protein